MNEPSGEHVEAVGEAMAPKPFAYYRGAYRHDPGAVVSYLKRAERILTSTDPAVLDAMQDALVRAGRLRVEESAAYSDDDGTTWYAMFGHAPSRAPMSRFVTEWRKVEP